MDAIGLGVPIPPLYFVMPSEIYIHVVAGPFKKVKNLLEVTLRKIKETDNQNKNFGLSGSI